MVNRIASEIIKMAILHIIINTLHAITGHAACISNLTKKILYLDGLIPGIALQCEDVPLRIPAYDAYNRVTVLDPGNYLMPKSKPY
jgi:hypothetical protein